MDSSSAFVRNAKARRTLLSAYRGAARVVCWLPGPRVWVNSFPKAGTHLVMAALEVLPRLMLSRQHIANHEINLASSGPLDNKHFILNGQALHRALRRANRGQVVTSHMPLHLGQRLPETVRGAAAAVHMIRDPRDMLLSEAHYILRLERHPLHRALGGGDTTLDEAVKLLITGRDESGIPIEGLLPYSSRLERFDGWLDESSALLVRYEELLGPDRGGDRSMQAASIERLARWVGRPLGPKEYEARLDRLQHKGTATLRRGGSGEWRDTLSSATLEMMAESLAPSMEAWGYK